MFSGGKPIARFGASPIFTAPFQSESELMKDPNHGQRRIREVPRSMAYFEAIRFVAHSPGWLVNLLWGSLCIVSAQIIPVAGQIVWMGYGVEVLESLLRGNQHALS